MTDLETAMAGLSSDLGAGWANVESLADLTADMDAEVKAASDGEIGDEARAIAESGLTRGTVRIRHRVAKVYNWETVKATRAKLESLPADGESLHGILGGDHNGFDLLPAILSMATRPAGRVDLATLGFNQVHAQALVDLQRNRQIAGTIRLVCSEYFKKRDRKVFAAVQGMLTDAGIAIHALRCHAKVILIDCGPGEQYTVETSANLRTCQSIEQFAIFNDAALLAFHRNWIDRLTQ